METFHRRTQREDIGLVYLGERRGDVVATGLAFYLAPTNDRFGSKDDVSD
jgi:hypothetical protein